MRCPAVWTKFCTSQIGQGFILGNVEKFVGVIIDLCQSRWRSHLTNEELWKFLPTVVKILILQCLPILLAVAFFTLLERKILGYVQTRKGPNKPGPFGLIIPFADAIKLFAKENTLPTVANQWLFMAVPCLSLMVPLLLWGAYPSAFELLFLKYSALWFLIIRAVSVYGILGAGWCRNRKYSLFGSIRAVAQSVSYEVCLTLIILHWIAFYEYTLNKQKLVSLARFLFGIMLMLFTALLAETNRSPFDFSEGERELVRGFNTEYRSIPFVIIFLAEYASILFMSIIIRLLFNMTGFVELYVFAVIWVVIFVWRRGTIPRLRYDQLINVAWKRFLPVTLCSVGFFLGV